MISLTIIDKKYKSATQGTMHYTLKVCLVKIDFMIPAFAFMASPVATQSFHLLVLFASQKSYDHFVQKRM